MERTALDLTDIFLFYQIDETVFPAYLKQTGCRRIYIGSYFCEKYFIKACKALSRKAACFTEDDRYRISLAVPVASGDMLSPVKNVMTETLESLEGLIDEVIVNDYGMLEYVSGPDMKNRFRIIAGRLFFKNYRDARYGLKKEISGPVLFPSELAGRVSAADLDLFSEDMDFSEIPEDIGIHIHYPFVYTTLSRICEFASARADDRMKFRTMMPCGNACMVGWMLTETEGTPFLHFGKAVYTKCPAKAEYSREPERFVYWPLEEFLSAESCEVYDADLNAL